MIFFKRKVNVDYTNLIADLQVLLKTVEQAKTILDFENSIRLVHNFDKKWRLTTSDWQNPIVISLMKKLRLEISKRIQWDEETTITVRNEKHV